MLPAIVPVRSVGVKERFANKCKMAKMAVRPEASPIVKFANEMVAAAVHSGADGGRRRDECRGNRGRGNATGKFGHHVNPPRKPATQALCVLAQMRDSASSAFGKLGMRRREGHRTHERETVSLALFVVRRGKASAAHGAKFAGELK